MIYNKFDFINLSNFTFKWEIKANGSVVKKGQFDISQIEANSSRSININYDDIEVIPGEKYFIHFSTYSMYASG